MVFVKKDSLEKIIEQAGLDDDAAQRLRDANQSGGEEPTEPPRGHGAASPPSHPAIDF